MLETIKDTIGNIGNKIGSIFGGRQEEEKPVFEQDLVDLVEREFKRRRDERRPFELQWRLNLAFYEGNQYVDINTASMALEEQPILYDWQEREVFNHIAPNIETRISKLKRVRPLLKVKPGTNEQEDFHSAKVGTMLLKNVYTNQDFRDKFNEELTWMEICGTVFEKKVWNPKLGKVIAIEEDPETGEQVEIYEGDTETVVCPPQEILPDSSYHSGIGKCRSVIHHKAFYVDEIFETWGVRVNAEKAEAEKLQRSMSGMGGLGYGQGGFRFHTVKLENHAIVKEYHEAPTKQHPEGRLIIVANGKLLHAGPLPFKVGEDNKPGLPFTRLICLERPGCFWGRTVLERLIPLQRRYNALRNRKAEYLNRCSIGQWFVEEESVDLDSFEQDAAAPGAVLQYRAGRRPPTPVQSPALPGNFEMEEERLLAEFSILSGVSEVSRDSSVPSGVKSGVAINLLQEQDNTRISNTAENIERFFIQSGKIELRLKKQYVTFPRTLHSIGRNNVVEVVDWMGSDICSDDVILDTTSAMTETIAQKRQMIFDLMGTNLLLDPDTGRIDKEMRSKVLEMIEMGEWESADDDDQLHMSKAERENRALEQGQFIEPVSYDEHIVHISRHNKYRLTTDYEELRAQNPMIEMMFAAHVDMHIFFIQQAAMAQQAAVQPQAPPQQKQRPGGDNAA